LLELNEEKLTTLAKLANKLKTTENEIAELERQLKGKKDIADQLSNIDIPEYMAELGLSSFALKDGTKLAVKPILDVRLPKGMEDEADRWLESHGHGGMVKTKIDVTMSKLSTKIKQIKEALDKLNIPYEVQKTIHYQTLNKWEREMEQEELVIPEEIFSIFRGNKVIIES
jgi:hypothetical protein